MEISTLTSYMSKKLGDKEAVRILAEIGYDALDYSFFNLDMDHTLNRCDYEKYALDLKNVADECGIYFNQTHAPFPSYIPNDDKFNKKIKNDIIRAIKISGILGAKYVIVHPIALNENQKQFNLDFYNSLIEYCKEYSVKIALENMFGWDEKCDRAISNVCSHGEDFIEYLDALDSQYFTACLDVGHAGLVGDDAAHMVRVLDRRLKALHIHDNDKVHDLHQLPFTQKLDWSKIMKALKDIDYDGELTFEADNFLRQFPDNMLVKASKFMYETGKQLVKMFKEA